MSKPDIIKINGLCNSLNAQQSLSNHLYSQTGNQREYDLSVWLRAAQSTINELLDYIEYLAPGAILEERR